MEVQGSYLTWKDSNREGLYQTKVLSKAALISISNDLIKEINKFICGFIWKGNDKIKDLHLLTTLKMGDLRYLYQVHDLSTKGHGLEYIFRG